MTYSDELELQTDKTTSKSVAPGLSGVRSRFLINIISNGVFIAVSIITNMWQTPFLIGHLGIAAFGMIPLVNSITSYLSILTNALDSAFSRFIVIDLEKNDVRGANQTFNTTLFGLVAIILVLTPVALGLSIFFPALFNVPGGWENDTRWLFILVVIASFITVITSSFSISTFIHSRFVASNVIGLIGLVVRVGLIALLFSLLPENLWYVGLGTLLASLATFVGFYISWRKLTPELQVSLSAFDRSRLQELSGMAGWFLVNTVGSTMLKRVDLVVVNAFFGAAITGGYGSVAQFSLLMEQLASAVQTVLRPIFLVKYAQQDLVGLERLAAQSIKLQGLVLALPVGILCGFAHPLLTVWLGPEYVYLKILLIINVSHMSLTLSMRALLYVQAAYNKVRWPGIATLICGFFSLGLAVLAGEWGGWGAAGVAAAVTVAWIVKSDLYQPIYTSWIMKRPWWKFLPTSIPVIIATLLVSFIAYGLTVIRMPNSWFDLAWSSILVSLLYAAGAWTIALGKDDRQVLLELLPWRRGRRPSQDK